MGEILSTEEAERAALHERCAQLWESHEALRARLAEVEVERDAAARFGEATQDWLRRRLAEVEQALRTALRVIDSTHALAFGRDALAPPCDGRSLAEHGDVGVYCWACEFTLQARAVLDKGEPDG